MLERRASLLRKNSTIASASTVIRKVSMSAGSLAASAVSNLRTTHTMVESGSPVRAYLPLLGSQSRKANFGLQMPKAMGLPQLASPKTKST